MALATFGATGVGIWAARRRSAQKTDQAIATQTFSKDADENEFIREFLKHADADQPVAAHS